MSFRPASRFSAQNDRGFPKKNLLVVEDDKGLQNQLRWAFDEFEVAVTGDRVEAIAQLRRLQPGVVLLDLGLPPDPGGVSEGMATLSEIQNIPNYTNNIPKINNEVAGIYTKCSTNVCIHYTHMYTLTFLIHFNIRLLCVATL